MATLGSIYFPHSYKKQKQQDQIDALKKSDTQQKRHLMMPFEENCTLQKWHMTNTPLEIDKYGSPKMWCLMKGTPCKKIAVMEF